MLYCQTDSLLLPVRNPGDKLPKELYEFYNNLVADVKTKLVLQQKKKQELLQIEQEAKVQESQIIEGNNINLCRTVNNKVILQIVAISCYSSWSMGY